MDQNTFEGMTQQELHERINELEITLARVAGERDESIKLLAASNERLSSLINSLDKSIVLGESLTEYIRKYGRQIDELQPYFASHPQRTVVEFMTASKQLPALDKMVPHVPEDAIVRKRLEFCAEEFFEKLEACLDGDARYSAMWSVGEVLRSNKDRVFSLIASPIKVDLPKLVDACIDCAYTNEGFMLSCSVDSKPAMLEVHAANMRKEFVTDQGSQAGVKVRKPEGWQPPNIEAVLEAQGWVHEPEPVRLRVPDVSEHD